MDQETKIQRRRLAARLLLVQQNSVLELVCSQCDSAEKQINDGDGKLTEQDCLLGLGMDPDHLALLRKLYEQLRENTVEFARGVVISAEAKLLTVQGPSEEQLASVERDVGMLSDVLVAVEKHCTQTSLHIVRLASLDSAQEAAVYLWERLFYVREMAHVSLRFIIRHRLALCGKNPDWFDDLDAMIRELASGRSECQTQVEQLKASRDEAHNKLQELMRARRDENTKNKDKKGEASEIRTATLVLKRLKQELFKAEEKLQVLSVTLDRANHLNLAPSGLLHKANAITRHLAEQNPKEITLGDRSVSFYSLHEFILGADDAEDLGAELAELVCRPEEEAQGVMAAHCVAAISNFVEKLWENNEFVHEGAFQAEKVEQAIREKIHSLGH